MRPTGQVAQSVEQRTENPCVGSSILPLPTFLCHQATLAQLVERLTRNEQVVGSSPTGGFSYFV